MIASFAWTTPALLVGAKTCTRRDWDPGYAQKFDQSDLVKAYDRSPRAHGNHIATIRLTVKPSYEPLLWMTDEDYEAEGFAWAHAHQAAFVTKTIEGLPRDHFIREVTSREGFKRWQESGDSMWVVRFELVELTTEGNRQLDVINSLSYGEPSASHHQETQRI